MTPIQWRNNTIGESFDVDNYPSGNKYQCWDYFAYFVQYMHLDISTYCSLTGYVCDLWRLKDKYGYSRYFEYITNPNDLRSGDFALWDRGSSHMYSHIAMVYIDNDGNPVELGQNQGYPYVTEKTTQWDILGAFRFKEWSILPDGCSNQTLNGHEYSFYKQSENQKTIVISAGLNKTLPIRSLDVDAPVLAKITGANYFNMESKDSDNVKNPDPVGTTYGDISAPLSDVWRELPNQDSTLFFDIESGIYGDCTGIHIDQDHNVFSPSVVYPALGNYQYARMVGIGHVNTRSRYTFSIRFADGRYAIGIANQDMTPKEIAVDMRNALGGHLDSVAFLDGGGSAMMGRQTASGYEYIHESDRACPSAVAIIATGSQSNDQNNENTQIPDDTEKDEEIPMDTMDNENNENQTILYPVKDDDWSDPETPAETTGETILKRFLSVKSFVTLTLTAVFSYLSITGRISQEQFMSVFTMCISFFFGYSFEKKTNSK